MRLRYVLAAICCTGIALGQAQNVGNFEDLSLPSANSNFLDIVPTPDGDYTFQTGEFIFSGNYNAAWDSWSGAVYSNVVDSLTTGFGNQFAAIAGKGYNYSDNYGVIYVVDNVNVKLSSNYANKVVDGFYVTNSTYAYYTMKDGDLYSKKFGGVTGNDPDFFKLTVIGYQNGQTLADSVHFYLADFRFADNSKDYIVDNWQFVNLASLGAVDSFGFILTSSDTGAFGMNTPAYFCVDNFSIKTNVSVQENAMANVKLFPNPATDYLHILAEEKIVMAQIFSINGKKEIAIENPTAIYIENLNSGVYFIQMQNANGKITTQKWIKN